LFFYALVAMRSTATVAVAISMRWRRFRSSKCALPETINSHAKRFDADSLDRLEVFGVAGEHGQLVPQRRQ
jgi:hypothetical protein